MKHLIKYITANPARHSNVDSQIAPLLAKVWLGLAGIFLWSLVGHTDTALLQQKDVKIFMHQMEQKYHFKHQELVSWLSQAEYQPQIIVSMEKPYEKKSWDVYKALFLTSERVKSGVKFWQENENVLREAEAKYHVPANIIVAIIGIETLYGKRQGDYRVLDALSTLAFYYPKRSQFFTKELTEYFLLCRQHHVSPTSYLGSYAGAIGKPQFMPSSYRFYAVDYGLKGRADLVNNDKDVISSVANYFQKHGWLWQAPVAVPAEVLGTKYHRVTMNAKHPNYIYKHLLALGIRPTESIAPHAGKMGVIALETDKGAEYWLAYPNFYVITRYNTSPQYALAVYLLSRQLQAEHTTG